MQINVISLRLATYFFKTVVWWHWHSKTSHLSCRFTWETINTIIMNHEIKKIQICPVPPMTLSFKFQWATLELQWITVIISTALFHVSIPHLWDLLFNTIIAQRIEECTSLWSDYHTIHHIVYYNPSSRGCRIGLNRHYLPAQSVSIKTEFSSSVARLNDWFVFISLLFFS